MTSSPVYNQKLLLELKYELLNKDEYIESFHASENKQSVRDQVLDSIKEIDDLKFHFTYIQKRKVPQIIRQPSRFYTAIGRPLLRLCLETTKADNMDRVLVIFDKALTRKEQNLFKGLIKPHLKAIGVPFNI